MKEPDPSSLCEGAGPPDYVDASPEGNLCMQQEVPTIYVPTYSLASSPGPISLNVDAGNEATYSLHTEFDDNEILQKQLASCKGSYSALQGPLYVQQHATAYRNFCVVQ